MMIPGVDVAVVGVVLLSVAVPFFVEVVVGLVTAVGANRTASTSSSTEPLLMPSSPISLQLSIPGSALRSPKMTTTRSLLAMSLVTKMGTWFSSLEAPSGSRTISKPRFSRRPLTMLQIAARSLIYRVRYGSQITKSCKSPCRTIDISGIANEDPSYHYLHLSRTHVSLEHHHRVIPIKALPCSN